MTEQETIKIIRLIKAYYPYLYKGITKDEAKAIITVWQKQFNNIDYDLVEMSLDDWGEKHVNAPSIAELKHNIFGMHATLDTQYSALRKDENADKAELEKLERWRRIAWSCMSSGKLTK